jgi:putative ABC transport system permease protein
MKIAAKYPTQSLFRTGMTLAMFMLVVFTLTAMNFIQAAMSAAFGDARELSGGFEIQGNAAPIPGMKAALEDAEGIQKSSITAVGEVSNLPAEVKQRGTDRNPESLYVQGVDGGYSNSVGYGFQTTAEGYGSARKVWVALQTEKDTAVISSDLAPSRNVSTFGPSVEPPVKRSGFYAEDDNLPADLYLHVTHRQHPPEYTRPGVPGAVGQAAAGYRRRLRRLAPDHLPARPPGVEGLPG